MHVYQLQRQDNDLKEAILYLQHIQLEEKECHNKKYGIWYEKLAPNDIVLLHNTRKKKGMSCKLVFKWLGLYKISNTIKGKDIYILEKLDGLWLVSIFIGN